MKTKMINGIEIHEGSRNVFADLGLPNPDKHLVKARLVDALIDSIEKLDLTQQEAAKRMGLTQPKVSEMIRGNFSGLSERKLMDCLTRLGFDIEIRLKPPRKQGRVYAGELYRGHLAVAFA